MELSEQMNAILSRYDDRVLADLLHSMRIRRHSQDWRDYERAKAAVAEMGFRPAQYERALAVLAKLIGV